MAESKSAKSSLDKVKVGDTVRVTYTDKDGKMVVSSVKAESKGMSKSEERKSGTKAEKKQP
jgi:ribosomal 50S subunit-recycling heat shock protein